MGKNYTDVGPIDSGNASLQKPSLTEEVRGDSVYHFWLTRDIEKPYFYDDWFRKCDSSSPDDLIVVHINCYGGNLDTAIQIYSALISSNAPIVIRIEGACCSGASLIAMAGTYFDMNPLAYMMIHSWSGGAAGKFSNVIENAEFQKRWFTKVMYSVYEDFCSKQEIESILNGKDLWLDADEVMQRFNNMVEKRKNMAEKNNAKREQMRERVEKMLEAKGMTLQDIV